MNDRPLWLIEQFAYCAVCGAYFGEETHDEECPFYEKEEA